MNKDFLRESVKHGTDEYAYAQYHIKDLQYLFYMSYHWHDEIEIIYIKKGTLEVIIDDAHYHGKAGDIYFVNPRQIHMMETEDLGVEYYTVLFNMNLIQFMYGDESSESFNSIEDEELRLNTQLKELSAYKDILGLIKDIIRINEGTSNKEGVSGGRNKFYKLESRIKLLEIMRILLLDVSEGRKGNESFVKNREIRRQILTFIEGNYTEKISLYDIAQVAHMSEKYFSRFFKDNFGMTFVDYVNRVRLEKAASLLKSTDDSVTEVAMKVGYANISYFIRSFKKAFGMSPHKFRNV